MTYWERFVSLKLPSVTHILGLAAGFALAGVSLGCTTRDDAQPQERLGAVQAAVTTQPNSAAPVCVILQRGTSGNVADALIAEVGDGPDKNYGSSSSLATGGAPGNQRQALIRFDVSSIPSGATITSATATLNVLLFGGAPTRAHPITTSWLESTVTWESFGGTFAAMPVATFPTGTPTSADLKSVVQGWVDGSIVNDGILLERDLTGSTVFCSSECPKAQRPRLDVCYLVGPCAGQPDGTACNDGNACTQTDTCQAGVCLGSNPMTCAALDQCHAAGTCNPSTGACSNRAVADGTACNDSNACSQIDTCQAGACFGGNPVTCATLDQCHAAGTCNPSTGACSTPAVADGTACNDSNACTQTDTCQVGACVGGNPTTCAALDQCHAAGTCNPSTGACSTPAVADGTACNDSNACTQPDACVAAVCQPGPAVPINNTNPCVMATCDPVAGIVTTAVTAGAPCSGTTPCGSTSECDGQGACVCTTPLPPDPATVASAQDLSVITSMADSTAFLYSGANPIQTGVAPGTIALERVAVLRGKVMTRAGAALPGATISVLGHPELGQTLSRADGRYDLAVNGGGLVTLDVTLSGFISARRTTPTSWQGFATVGDVALIPYDTQVTTVDLTAPTFQVAQGSVMSDADGTRRQVLMFQPGTQATMVMNNSTQPLSTLNVRATEFTVGTNGHASMPADLPATSGYTYAFEASADEAVAAGATSVQFNQPVIAYNENFLNAPVGGIVPVGFYDRQKAVWVAMPNGLVVKILSITGGLANLDTTGSGAAAGSAALAALGITDAERQQLAGLYAPGQSVWRAALTHFSWWDLNWPLAPPQGARAPSGGTSPARLDLSCGASGSVIGCETQDLGEDLPVMGAPLSLHYSSMRMRGRTDDFTVTIPISGSSLAGTQPKRIDVFVSVAGRDFPLSFATAPNISTSFTWDGKDAYGRTIQGTQELRADIGYVYDAVYVTPAQSAASFASYAQAGVVLSQMSSRNEVTLHGTFTASVGHHDPTALRQGGWTLSAHHTYDSGSRVLHLGTGGDVFAQNLPSVANFVTAVGSNPTTLPPDGTPAKQVRVLPTALAVAPDGGLYIGDLNSCTVRRVNLDGTVTTVAGVFNNACGFAGVNGTGDGGSATQAILGGVTDIALGPDGSLYIVDNTRATIRRVTPDGNINTLAGGAGNQGGDGGPALLAHLNSPGGIAVAPDGSLYLAEPSRLRRIGTDGIINTIPGSNNIGLSSATLLKLSLDVNGAVYIPNDRQVLRLTPDSTLVAIAGLSSNPGATLGDGGQAINAGLQNPVGAFPTPDGGFLIADTLNFRVRAVTPDGIIKTITGTGAQGLPVNGAPAAASPMRPDALAVAPDGSFYVGVTGNGGFGVVVKIASSLPGFSPIGSGVIPSADGTELYVFDTSGRHLSTLDALTGVTRFQFAYTTFGGSSLLTSVTDLSGNVTTITRDPQGNATAIVGPFGQTTTLGLDSNGYLASVTDLVGATTGLVAGPTGLLNSLFDPRGNQHQFTYDAVGRLINDADPAGGFTALSRTNQGQDYTVSLTSALGRTESFQVQNLPTGVVRRVGTTPSGLITTVLKGTDGSLTRTSPDGMIAKTTLSGDPRFGLAAPLFSTTTTTPGGLIFTQSSSRSVVLANPSNPLSLQSLTDTTRINGQSFTSLFNVAAHTLTTQTPLGRTSVTTLDAQGRLVGVQVPGVTATQLAYDAQGQLVSITEGPRLTTMTYDAGGNLTSVTDPLNRTTSFTHDADGRILAQTFPDGRVIGTTHDASGNVTAITPPGRPAHLESYTPVDLLASYTPPDIGSGSTTTQYAYNLDRQPIQITRPDGSVVSLAYDVGGRLSGITSAAGTTTFSYQPTTGHLATVTTPGGSTLSYAYDGTLWADTTWTGAVAGAVHRTYDNFFRLATESVNGGSNVGFQYDNDGLLTGVDTLSVSRDPQNGRPTGSSIGQVADTLNYNTTGEVSSYQATFSAAAQLSEQYTRDAGGRIVQKVETIAPGPSHTFAYSYDQAGRLRTVDKDGAAAASYTYDSNSNRLSQVTPGGTTSGQYDAQDRLLQYGGNTYSYTANGELLTKTAASQITGYTYDALGKLTGAVLPDGTQIFYVIDGSGRRVGKRVNGAPVQGFLYRDFLSPIAELDGNGAVVSRFVYSPSAWIPAFMTKGGHTYRILTDQLGSPRLVLDVATGAVAQEMNFDEFGNVTMDTNPGFQPFGFAAGILDRDTGLVHFGAREYDPESGRWTTMDPLRLGGGPNLYTYAENEPVNTVDPAGEWGIAISSSVAVAIGKAVGIAGSASTGLFVDFSEGTVSPFASAGLGGAIVEDVSMNVGVSVSLVFDSSKFWGKGTEVGLGPVAIGWSTPSGCPTDFQWPNSIGYTFGIPVAGGTDAHLFTTKTKRLGKVDVGKALRPFFHALFGRPRPPVPAASELWRHQG